MSKLADLKAAATAKLATVHADVTTYITALETQGKQSKYWIGGGAVLGALVGWFAHNL